MNLFRCPRATPCDEPADTSVKTPLGTVDCGVWSGDRLLSEECATSVHSVGMDGYIVRWDRPQYRLELLCCRPVIKLHGEIRLFDCRAFVWRLHARDELEPIVFRCLWQPGYIWTESVPDTEEYLYARTWSKGRMEVTVGTDDDEGLLDRARYRDWLPRSWVPIFDPGKTEWAAFWDHPAHRPFDAGLSVPLPGLLPKQRCQVHFVIAWAPRNRKGYDAWMATHLPARRIISDAGCK